MNLQRFNSCRWDIIICSLRMLIEIHSGMYFYIKILRSVAFKALCINKFDLSRGDYREGRLCEDSVTRRQTSDDNRERRIWSKSDYRKQPKTLWQVQKVMITESYTNKHKIRKAVSKNGERLCSLVSRCVLSGGRYKEERLKSSPDLNTSLSQV